MKKIIFTFLSYIIIISTVNAQKGVDFSRFYAAGGKMTMCVDSAAKNVFYANGFINQPHTFFNFLPEVHHVSMQIYFRKTENPKNYRYTILEDDKLIVLNKSFDLAQMKEDHAGSEEIFDVFNFGIFSIKEKIITIITYDIQKPQEVNKTIFYGKSIPKAEIKGFAVRFKTDKDVDYNWIDEPKDNLKLNLTEKDDELTLIKNRSDIDYLYSVSIKDKQSNAIIFKSNVWTYGGIVEEGGTLPIVQIDRNIFKKSGDYEIIIQPSIKWTGCTDCNMTPKQIEKYITRYMLSITIEQENYTKKELLIYAFIAAFSIGLVFLVILYFTKRRNKKILVEKEQQKNMVKVQLNSIRSQLNPHFLFNALAGIQNLMNKNEIDNANKYLSKFARLTRHVLDGKELISLAQEKRLLDDYLQMEQLRFGFEYEINHSEDLDLDNIEIPSMLLQPFAENAVKHGISQKTTDGKVTVAFIKQVDDLVLMLGDNGNGFDTAQKNNGLGLLLSDSRIALLNDIYKENRFILAIESTGKGTIISLTLTDWLR